MPEMKAGISEKVEKYKGDVKELSRYLEYLKSRMGTASASYNDPSEGKKTTMMVPTYDSALLSFVKCVQKTAFLDRNYMYVYRRYNMRTEEDEHRQIERTPCKHNHRALLSLVSTGDEIFSSMLYQCWTSSATDFNHHVMNFSDLKSLNFSSSVIVERTLLIFIKSVLAKAREFKASTSSLVNR